VALTQFQSAGERNAFRRQKLSDSASDNLSKAVRPPRIHLWEEGKKHNSLAKFPGFPDQTVETEVDENLNERLIKNRAGQRFQRITNHILSHILTKSTNHSPWRTLFA
jgi:hypothetical protein